MKSIEVAGTTTVIEELQKVETQVITRKMIENDRVEVELVLPDGVESLDGNKITLKLKKITRSIQNAQK